jgi:hypothetical protein
MRAGSMFSPSTLGCCSVAPSEPQAEATAPAEALRSAFDNGARVANCGAVPQLYAARHLPKCV